MTLPGSGAQDRDKPLALGKWIPMDAHCEDFGLFRQLDNQLGPSLCNLTIPASLLRTRLRRVFRRLNDL